MGCTGEQGRQKPANILTLGASPGQWGRNLLTESSYRNRGDQGIGPQAGRVNMRREDDDDDDFVGFRRLSALRHQGTLQDVENSLCGIGEFLKDLNSDVS